MPQDGTNIQGVYYPTYHRSSYYKYYTFHQPHTPHSTQLHLSTYTNPSAINQSISKCYAILKTRQYISSHDILSPPSMTINNSDHKPFIHFITDNTHSNQPPLLTALLDSGTTTYLISQQLTQYLNLEVQPLSAPRYLQGFTDRNDKHADAIAQQFTELSIKFISSCRSIISNTY